MSAQRIAAVPRRARIETEGAAYGAARAIGTDHEPTAENASIVEVDGGAAIVDAHVVDATLHENDIAGRDSGAAESLIEQHPAHTSAAASVGEVTVGDDAAASIADAAEGLGGAGVEDVGEPPLAQDVDTVRQQPFAAGLLAREGSAVDELYGESGASQMQRRGCSGHAAARDQDICVVA